MKLHKVSSLDSSQTRQIQTMVNKCTDADRTRLSFPFDEASLFLYFEQGGSIVSAIAFIPMEDLLYECSAFTDPEFRGQGLFSELLDAGIDELPEDSELIFYADKKNSAAAAVLEAIGAELDSEEHMMELLPEDFSAASFPLTADISEVLLDVDGTPTRHFSSDNAVINFSVFPSHYYLYGFEVKETCRGKGYGTNFLQTVLTMLSSENKILLQVSGDNAPALALYKKTGFRISETLCCYLY